MNLLASLATQIAGGTAAFALDQSDFGKKYTYVVGKSDTFQGVAVTPGAMGAVGLAILLALVPGASGSMWRLLAANLAGGALVYEGTVLAKDQILPLLKTPQGTNVPAINAGGAVAANGIGRGGSGASFELAHAMASFRAAQSPASMFQNAA